MDYLILVAIQLQDLGIKVKSPTGYYRQGPRVKINPLKMAHSVKI